MAQTCSVPSYPSPESAWRMPGFFLAAVAAVAAVLGILAALAGPAVHGGLAPVWGPGYMTYPVTVATR